MQMKEREGIAKLSALALQRRRQGLAKRLPPLEEILRGTLLERCVTCGKPNCKCARGERHGPAWYLNVTLDQAHRTSETVPAEQVERVRKWIDNFHQVRDNLEKISDINRELLRRQKRSNNKRGAGRTRAAA